MERCMARAEDGEVEGSQPGAEDSVANASGFRGGVGVWDGWTH